MSNPAVNKYVNLYGDDSPVPRRIKPSDIPQRGSITPPVQLPVAATPSKPGMSLIAAATRITGETLKGGMRRRSTAETWQDDAWEMYDLVGEQRFLASTLANQMSKARFYVGKVSDDPLDPPVQTENVEYQNILDSIGNGPSGLAQLVQRLSLNLFIAGDGWLVGIPPALLPDAHADSNETEQPVSTAPSRTSPASAATSVKDADLAIEDLDWRMLSVSEVSLTVRDSVDLTLGGSAFEKIEVSPDDVYLIRVWRPHPRKFWEADSPTRSSLPVLRELVGLTMHISAQIDSRLAGAGLLVVPESAVRAMKRSLGMDEDGPEDPFTESLMKAMITPISDRSNASAIVPLVAVVPDEVTDKFRLVTFDKPLDVEAREMRDEAIRRLALGQDAPPELLLGMGGASHWSAWLVQEDVISTHVEPPLALICDALSTQYLRPVLREMGMDETESREYVIWYDVSHMIIRPNRLTDAQNLYEKGVITSDALRDAAGFSEDDAPASSRLKDAQRIALDMVAQNSSLMASPGLTVLVEQIQSLIDGGNIGPTESMGDDTTLDTSEGVDTSGDIGIPNIADAPTEPPTS